MVLGFAIFKLSNVRQHSPVPATPPFAVPWPSPANASISAAVLQQPYRVNALYQGRLLDLVILKDYQNAFLIIPVCSFQTLAIMADGIGEIEGRPTE